MMRLLTLVLLTSLLVACEQKQVSRKSHDTATPAPTEESPSSQTAEAEPIVSADSTKLLAQASALQRSVFGPAGVDHPLQGREKHLRADIDRYQKILVLAARDKIIPQAELQKILGEHSRLLFMNCLLANDACRRLDVFSGLPSSIELLLLIAQRTQDLDIKFRHLRTAFDFGLQSPTENAQSERFLVLNVYDEYLINSADYARCLIEKRCQAGNKSALDQHYRLLRMIAETYPRQSLSKQLIEQIEHLDLFSNESSNPLKPVQDVFLRRFGTALVYGDMGLSREMKARIDEQQNRPKSYRQLMKRWQTLDLKTAEGRAEQTAVRHVLPASAFDLKENEYLFLIESLFLNEMDTQVAATFWQATRQDREIFLNSLNIYVQVRFLEAILKSNRGIKSIYNEMRLKVRPNLILYYVTAQSEELKGGLWEPFQDRQRSLWDFYQRHIGLLPLNAKNVEVKDDILKTRLQIEDYFRGFGQNLNTFVVAPLMWILADILQSQNINFSYRAEFLSMPDNVSYRNYYSFFRDMFENHVLPTWFLMTGDQTPIRRPDAVLSLYNVFRFGLLELFEVPTADFIRDLAHYYLAQQRVLLENSLSLIQSRFVRDDSLSRFLGVCAREAETRCTDFDQPKNRNANGALRVCAHQEDLAGYRRYARLPTSIELGELENYAYTGKVTGVSRSDRERSLLEKGTDFYSYPNYQEARRGMDEMLEITRTEVRVRVEYLRVAIRGLAQFNPAWGEDFTKPILDRELENVSGLMEEIWALIFSWDNKIGDCQKLLAFAEQERQWDVIEAESEVLRAIHKDMKKLRDYKDRADFTPAGLDGLKAELNRRYRFPDSPVFKQMRNFDEVYPAINYGFNENTLSYNATLFFMRVAHYLNSGTLRDPERPLSPYLRIIIREDGRTPGINANRDIRPIEWIENEDEFVSEALSWTHGFTRWFFAPDTAIDFAQKRGKFLIRALKLGPIEIKKSTFDKIVRQTPNLMKTCRPTQADHVCLEVDPEALVDDVRAQAQAFQLYPRDVQGLPLVKREFRIASQYAVKDFYCDIKVGLETLNQCNRQLNHFDFFLHEMDIFTSNESEPGNFDPSAHLYIPRTPFDTIARRYQSACDNTAAFAFSHGQNLLSEVDDHMRTRVRSEFAQRENLRQALKQRYEWDRQTGTVVPLFFNLVEGEQATPLYYSSSDWTDSISAESKFHRDTNYFYDTTRACAR